jgi:chitin disaccharide deacetylase
VPGPIPANLIINADDFGLDPRVSLAIAACLDEGLINSFSVFPFSDPFHDRLLREVLARHPGVRVGAHLTLVGSADSAEGADNEARLREHKDHFREFLGRYLTGHYPSARVKREWKAQIEFVGGYLGGPGRLAHLDSHQHLHVLPGVWKAARALQREYGIPRMRVPFESLRRAAFHRFPFGLAFQLLARLRRDDIPRRFLGFMTSTRFTVDGNLAGLQEVMRRPEVEFELMVHPALPPMAPPPGWSGEEEITVAESQVREIGELRKLAALFGDSPATGPV